MSLCALIGDVALRGGNALGGDLCALEKCLLTRVGDWPVEENDCR